MKLSKLLFAVVGATVLLGALVSSASARSIAGNTTRLTAFSSLRFEGAFGSSDCVITLSSSLHSRTITKSPGTLIGYIDDARLGACSSISATILRETLPWHVRYRSFSGTLPNITRISTDVIGFAVKTRIVAESCLLRSEVNEPVIGDYTVVGGSITDVTIRGSIRTDPGCFGVRLRVNSAGGTVTGEAGTVTVRLI